MSDTELISPADIILPTGYTLWQVTLDNWEGGGGVLAARSKEQALRIALRWARQGSWDLDGSHATVLVRVKPYGSEDNDDSYEAHWCPDCNRTDCDVAPHLHL